jgi:hypothetical protein
MQSNKIGQKCPIFWIAWAFVAEKAKNFNLTDKIFQKGIKRYCRKSSMNPLSFNAINFLFVILLHSQDDPKEKGVLQKRYQQFQRRMARQYLTMSEMNGNGSVPESKDQECNRKALGVLCKSQARAQVPRSSSHIPSQGSGGSSTTTKKSNQVFDIFEDSSAPEEAELYENENWKMLPKQKDSHKENSGIN